MASWLRRVWQRVRQRPGLVLGASLLLVLVLGGLGWDAYQVRAARRAVREERFADASRCLQLRWAFWPRSAEPWLLAARIHRLNNEYEAAEAALDRARAVGGDSEALQIEWLCLRAQRGKGEVDEVAPGLWRCVQSNHPDSAWALEAMARAYMRDARFLPALVCLNKWLELQPETPRALEWRGWANEHVQRPGAAMRDYQKAVELAPERWGPRLRLANLMLQVARHLDALPHLEWVLREQPNNLEAKIGLGKCRFYQGNFDEAIRLLDEVLQESPEEPQALFFRAKIETARTSARAAEPYLRRALRADPYLQEAQYALVQCLRAQGAAKQKEAVRALARWNEIKADSKRLTELLNRGTGSGSGSPEVPLEIGELFLRMNQGRLAEHWLQVALARGPQHGPTHEALARLYQKLDVPEKAALHARLAREASPSRDLRPAPR